MLATTRMISVSVVLCFLCSVFTLGHGQAIDCSTSPFAAPCLQRRAFKRSSGIANIPTCRKANDFTGRNVLVNVKSSNSTDVFSNVENNIQPDERNEDCLLQQLRPKFTGYPSRSDVRVDYRACRLLDTNKGYIILEYTCIKRDKNPQTIQLPQCSGSANGSRISIETNNFPHSGMNTTGTNCRCSINTGAQSIKLTTYYMDLTNLQSVVISGDKGVAFNSTEIPKDEVMVTKQVPVNGTLFLSWQNMETAIRSMSKFWFDIEANGTIISVNCNQPQTHTTTEISTYTTTNAKQTTQPIEVTSETVHTETSGTDESIRGSSEMPLAVLSSTPSMVTRDTPSSGSSSTSVKSSSSVQTNEGSTFPLIPVIVGVVAFLVIIIVVIIAYIVYRKHKRNRTNENPIVNTSFDISRLPPLPIAQRNRYDTNVNRFVEQETFNNEDDEIVHEGKKKKKKKKKKRKKENKVFPLTDQAIDDKSDGDTLANDISETAGDTEAIYRDHY